MQPWKEKRAIPVTSTGSGDKRDLELPGLQLEILKMAYESGKPVVLVMLSGSALSFNWADRAYSGNHSGLVSGGCRWQGDCEHSVW